MTPFSREQFFQVFADYNAAIWPLQVVLAGAALVALYSVRAKAPAAVPPVILAILWAWSGSVYHLVFFRPINPAALIFGSLFLMQAVVLLAEAHRRRLVIRFRSSLSGWVGAAFVVYALVLYPLLGSRLGHAYPNAPTFGAPCPLTIFTLGLLLWNEERTRWYVLAVPIAWSVIGSSAAMSLGVREDFALPAAALLTVAIMVATRMRPGERALANETSA